jgi:xanthine dehydrogenase accessory factor
MLPDMVLIRGAGDLASGVAHRLHQSGFKVVMLELPNPMVVRTTVSFATAVLKKSITVEGVVASLCNNAKEAEELLSKHIIPVIIDPEASTKKSLNPLVVIDAIMAKDNRLTKIDDAELVIGLGPGFTAGKDVHAIIETKRGHNLGKVIYRGTAAENTSIPGDIAGYGPERLLRASTGGIFKPLKNIGDLVNRGQTVATVSGKVVRAETDGMVRGMLFDGVEVKQGDKVGDVDPRGKIIDYMTISDKARAVGGGVLEAILHRYN